MIAPLREPLEQPRSVQQRRNLQRVRRIIASTLLKHSTDEPTTKPVPTWQAWLLAAWMLATAVTYLTIMLSTWK
jgi:hypothetical protein